MSRLNGRTTGIRAVQAASRMHYSADTVTKAAMMPAAPAMPISTVGMNHQGGFLRFLLMDSPRSVAVRGWHSIGSSTHAGHDHEG